MKQFSSQNTMDFILLQHELFIKPNYLLKQGHFILLEFINIFLKSYLKHL